MTGQSGPARHRPAPGELWHYLDDAPHLSRIEAVVIIIRHAFDDCYVCHCLSSSFRLDASSVFYFDDALIENWTRVA